MAGGKSEPVSAASAFPVAKGQLPVSHRRVSHSGSASPRSLWRFVTRSARIPWVRALWALALVILLVNGASRLGGSSAPQPGQRPPRVVPAMAPGGLEPAVEPTPLSEWAEAGYRIPRVLHQTYRSSRVPSHFKALQESWRTFNKGWEVHFYTDDDCLDFVASEFPEYLEAFQGLEKDVERADFFRYMVVLKHGGAYADIDTECRVPLESLISPGDALVVGYESAFPTWDITWNRGYARKMQLEQWFFMAAPGHPVLRDLCDWIAANYQRPLNVGEDRDTLERTGPGVWTDKVLAHALRQSEEGAEGDAAREWAVRLYPRVTFGYHKGRDGIAADASGIAVVHYFAGSWKAANQVAAAVNPSTWVHKAEDAVRHYDHAPLSGPEADLAAFNVDLHRYEAQAGDADPQAGLAAFPVTVPSSTPFDVMVRLMGHGEVYVHTDVSADLATWGHWQPVLARNREPTVADVLVDALEGYRSDYTLDARGVALVDVGAGLGYLSLTAASKGFAAHAFEASWDNLDLLTAAARRNQFGDRLQVHEAALGDAELDERVCVQRGSFLLARHRRASGGDADASAGESGSDAAAAARRSLLDRVLSPSLPEVSDSVEAAVREARREAERRAEADPRASRTERVRDVMRAPHSRPGLATGPGESVGDVRAAVPEEWDALAYSEGYSAVPGTDTVGAAHLGPCLRSVPRTTLERVLADARRSGLRVGALRISAFGHEASVIRGAARVLREDRPHAVLVELHPDLAAIRGVEDPVAVLREIHAMGYSAVAHAGHVCDVRWAQLVEEAGLGDAGGPPGLSRQPTWCRIGPEDFGMLATEALPGVPELVLFSRDADVELAAGDEGDGGPKATAAP